MRRRFPSDLLVSFPREIPSLSSRLKLRGNDIQWTIFSIHGAMPNAPAKRCDVDFFGVFRIRNDAVSPFEVKTRYLRPAFPAIVVFPCRRGKPGSCEYFGVRRSYGYL